MTSARASAVEYDSSWMTTPPGRTVFRSSRHVTALKATRMSTRSERAMWPSGVTRSWYHVGRPSMFDGKTFFGATGMPILKIARVSTRLAVWLPEPLTVAAWIVRSLTMGSVMRGVADQEVYAGRKRAMPPSRYIPWAVKVATPKETADGERRVALIPDTAAKLAGAGLQVAVEAGAGQAAFITDAMYEQAKATVVADAASLLRDADAVLKVQPPTPAETKLLRKGAVLISFLQPATQGDLVRALTAQGVTAFSLELVPRISRAQSMDALSSQASASGYKSVLMAAERLGKFFPMMMTAAGTVAPARVLVMGAGVAGLQAIATARRLGAVVSAYDVRPAVKEEVQSLGATFIELG